MTGTKERIQKLERQVRFQRTLLTIVLLAAAVFLLASAASNDRPVEKLVAREVVVVNDEGEPAVVLKSSETFSGLLVFDEFMDTRGAVVMLGDYKEERGLSVINSGTAQTSGLVTYDDGRSFLAVSNTSGSFVWPPRPE